MSVLFPIHDAKRPAPLVAEACVVCGRNLAERWLGVHLSGGALLKESISDGAAGPDPRMEGFLSIDYHEACADGSDNFASLPIVREAEEGQYDIAFCSLLCFRTFIADLLTSFEERVHKAQEERGQ
jgi:hypothetical protein